MATFYVIGTPIGNLEDVTLRSLRIFKEVDLVLCEDTRVTRNLFSKYGISTPTMSYHAQSKLSKVETILDMLTEGKNIALVSDAGTPGISDPGSMLVSKIRELKNDSIRIESVPGPSALTTALSIAGVPCADFVFCGFLPHKKGRETLFTEMATSERTMIFYESPHRIIKALESLAKFAPAKCITIARELTKIHEEVVSGSAAELVEFFAKNTEKIRGEFVVIVSA